MAPHSSVLAWRIPGTGRLVGFRLWGCTESDTTEATQQQQQQQLNCDQYLHSPNYMDIELSKTVMELCQKNGKRSVWYDVRELNLHLSYQKVNSLFCSAKLAIYIVVLKYDGKQQRDCAKFKVVSQKFKMQQGPFFVVVVINLCCYLIL